MIRRWFRSMHSFGDKVTWLLTLTSAVAIALVCFTLSAVDYAYQRRETLASLEAQTLIVAMNSGAPLAFSDHANAAEALAAFRARPAVAQATLYDVSGRVFAQYLRSARDGGGQDSASGGLFPRWYSHRAPVEDRGQLLGRIEVRSDMRGLYQHLVRMLLLSLLVSAFAVGLVYAFALQIRGLLVRPIALLSATARQVSQTKDYSLRAAKVSDDELGEFTDTFNQMLEQIRKQDLEIHASRADALHAGRLKDEFLATLSHELRTPMTPILGWAQILQRNADGNPQVLQAAEVIERNARAQNRIIDDLLDMSRIVSGKVRLDVRPVDLAQLIADSVDTVTTAAQARGIVIERDIDPTVGFVPGDCHRLQQVLWNLLTNAIKFTGPHGQVVIVLRPVEGTVEVAVRDTGQGIGADFLPHVFERFRQADSSNTRQHSGLGLGLAIVKQLVEMHGGQVRVESPGEGKGATFTVSLPVRASGPDKALTPAPGNARVAAVKTPMAVAGTLSGQRVLVVDDEQDARHLIGQLLEDCGAQVRLADCAQTALEILGTWHPDILLSDIAMPDQSGYELLEQVRALPAASGGDIPAIALTAFARPEDRERALIAGFAAHVAKPVDQAGLLEVVMRVAGVRIAAGEDDVG